MPSPTCAEGPVEVQAEPCKSKTDGIAATPKSDDDAVVNVVCDVTGARDESRVEAQSETATSVEAKQQEDVDQAQSSVEELRNIMSPDVCVFHVCVPQSSATVKVEATYEDSISEIRLYLSEHPEACFYTCYHLELDGGRKLNDYATVKECQLQPESRLRMVQDHYDERSARQHVRRMREILVSPPLLNEVILDLDAPTGAGDGESTEMNSSNNSSNAQRTKPNQQQQSGRSGQRNNNKRGQRGTNNNNTSGSKDDVNDGSSSPSLQQSFHDIDLTELHHGSLTPRVDGVVECLRSVRYSAWNPPPSSRKLKGDLMYVEVDLLDRNTPLFITASTDGFYVNASTPTAFNPDRSGNNTSPTLVKLLQQVSPMFRTRWSQLLNRKDTRHPFQLTQCPEPVRKPWNAIPDAHTADWNRAEDALQFMQQQPQHPTHGLQQDWNEEYQLCRSLPVDTLTERIACERQAYKVYCEFADAVIKGACAVVEGNVPAMNGRDPDRQHVCLHNNIFYSYSIDSTDKYKDMGGDAAARCSAKHDLKGVRLFQEASIKGLHTVLTAVIDYRGHRVEAQGIFPGILHCDMQADNLLYGNSETATTTTNSNDTRTTTTTPPATDGTGAKVAGSFKNDVSVQKAIADADTSLPLKEHVIIDAQGKEQRTYLSADTKAMRGADRRVYVLDLNRCLPRDANYLTNEQLAKYNSDRDAVEQKHDEDNNKHEEEKDEHHKTTTTTTETTTTSDKASLSSAGRPASATDDQHAEASSTSAAADTTPSPITPSASHQHPYAELAMLRYELVRAYRRHKALERVSAYRQSKRAERQQQQQTQRAKTATTTTTTDTTTASSTQQAAGDDGSKAVSSGRPARVEMSTDTMMDGDDGAERVIVPSVHKEHQQTESSTTHDALKPSSPSPDHKHGSDDDDGAIDAHDVSLGTTDSDDKQQQSRQPSSPSASDEDAVHDATDDDSDEMDDVESAIIMHTVASLRFNVDCFNSQVRLGGDASAIREDEDRIVDISRFLIDRAIPALVAEMESCPPTDTIALTSVFHEHGVNMRYLGRVCDMVKDEQVKQLCIDEAIARCAKHLLNTTMRDVPRVSQLSTIIARFLNSLLGCTSSSSQSGADDNSNSGKVKQGKRQGKNRGTTNNNTTTPQQESTTTTQPAPLAEASSSEASPVADEDPLSPANLWQAIKQQALARFNITIPESSPFTTTTASSTSLSSSSFERIRMLRSLCLKTGVQVVARGYDWTKAAPMTADDIVDVMPILHTNYPSASDARQLMSMSRQHMQRHELNECYETLNDALALYCQVVSPIHKEAADVFSSLAGTLSQAGELAQAVEHERRALIIYERLLGPDHPTTAVTYTNLAIYLLSMSKQAEALPYILRSLYLHQLIAGPYHSNTISSYIHAGMIYQDLGKPSIAVVYLGEALVRCKAVGDAHLQTAVVHHSLAICYAMMYAFTVAVEHETKSKDIYSHYLGNKHSNVMESIYWITQFQRLQSQVVRGETPMIGDDIRTGQCPYTWIPVDKSDGKPVFTRLTKLDVMRLMQGRDNISSHVSDDDDDVGDNNNTQQRQQQQQPSAVVAAEASGAKAKTQTPTQHHSVDKGTTGSSATTNTNNSGGETPVVAGSSGSTNVDGAAKPTSSSSSADTNNSKKKRSKKQKKKGGKH